MTSILETQVTLYMRRHLCQNCVIKPDIQIQLERDIYIYMYISTTRDIYVQLEIYKYSWRYICTAGNI